MRNRWWVVNVAIAMAVSGANYGSLDDGTARQLVRQALIVMKQNGPSVSLVPYTYSYAPEFWAYEAMWPNPNGSGLSGYFAVNPWTGDVWETNACQKISSPAMKKIQEAVWKKSKLLPEAEGTLHERAPGCISGSPVGAK